jgi:hypothetical protein
MYSTKLRLERGPHSFEVCCQYLKWMWNIIVKYNNVSNKTSYIPQFKSKIFYGKTVTLITAYTYWSYVNTHVISSLDQHFLYRLVHHIPGCILQSKWNLMSLFISCVNMHCSMGYQELISIDAKPLSDGGWRDILCIYTKLKMLQSVIALSIHLYWLHHLTPSEYVQPPLSARWYLI